MNILFFSPHTLADSTSGAARSVHTLFEELQRQGHTCKAVTGAMVDAPGDLFRRVLDQAPAAHIDVTIDGERANIPLRRVTIEGVAHVILGDRPQGYTDFLAYEEAALREVFLSEFAQFKPDILLTYSGFASNRLARQHARAHGAKVVLYAVADGYSAPSDFDDLDAAITVSHAMAGRLKTAATVPVHVIPPFVRARDVARPAPEFITFINPVAAKGLRLAVALAAECQRLGRPYRFLFVESRGTRAAAAVACPELAALTNVDFAGNVSDIALVYARTRVLLFPSLWFEPGGQSLIEANAAGIPALASNVGGIAEMLDGAGFLFEPPAAMREDWMAPPPADDVAKWLATLDVLETDTGAAAEATARAKAAAARYDLSALARRFIAAAMS